MPQLNWGDTAIRGTDYAITPNSHTGTATIAAGSTTTRIRIPIAGDNIYNPNQEKTFTLKLSNPTGGASIAYGVARGSINDNDSEPTLMAPTTISVSEADGNVSIPISLSNMSSEIITVQYTANSGTATGNGRDFVSGSDQTFRISALSTNPSILITNNR